MWGNLYGFRASVLQPVKAGNRNISVNNFKDFINQTLVHCAPTSYLKGVSLLYLSSIVGKISGESLWQTLPGVLVNFSFSPHKIYLFFEMPLPTGVCEGRVSRQLHGTLLYCQLVLNHCKPQIASAEAALVKLHCCCLSWMCQLWVAEQPLSAWCCLENREKVGKGDAAWQWRAKDNAPERIKVPLSQLYLKGG